MRLHGHLDLRGGSSSIGPGVRPEVVTPKICRTQNHLNLLQYRLDGRLGGCRLPPGLVIDRRRSIQVMPGWGGERLGIGVRIFLGERARTID